MMHAVPDGEHTEGGLDEGDGGRVEQDVSEIAQEAFSGHGPFPLQGKDPFHGHQDQDHRQGGLSIDGPVIPMVADRKPYRGRYRRQQGGIQSVSRHPPQRIPHVHSVPVTASLACGQKDTMFITGHGVQLKIN